MKYAVDRIIEDIVILENIEDKTILELNKNILPDNIKEGNIIIKEDNNYIVDEEEEIERRKRIEEKLNKIRS